MALNYYAILLLFVGVVGGGDVCPKQCDCDMDNGLNRALCVDQNIVSIDIGIPKEVQVYSLSHNVISELDNFCFKEAGYSSIRILNLSYNLIFWIGLHAFSGLEELVHLDLSNNRLRYLPADLFWDAPRLESLDLSANVFESLKNEPFLMHTNLQVLNLNNCRIKSLPGRLFTRVPNLRKLDISENYMITLDIDVLRPLKKLARLELKSEYWQCNPEFIAAEAWISSHGITYDKTCKKKLPNRSEKMISMVAEHERQDVDIEKVWNVTGDVNKTKATEPVKKLTPFQKFDQEFPSFQAFIIGIEIGLAVGITATYIWLRSLCRCGRLNCSRPQSRRQRRRMQRIADSDMRANLLWSTIVNPDLETPPSFRRQLSLPDRSPPFPTYCLAGLGEPAAPIHGIQVADDRSETPPPPYYECRISM